MNSIHKGGASLNTFQKLRKEAGITQEELAGKLQIDRSTVAKWESSMSLPRSDLLPKIAKVLGCTIDELLKSEQKIN